MLFSVWPEYAVIQELQMSIGAYSIESCPGVYRKFMVRRNLCRYLDYCKSGPVHGNKSIHRNSQIPERHMEMHGSLELGLI